MKYLRSISRFPFLIVLVLPLLSAADLATYRGFQLGMSLTAAVKHSGMDVSEVALLHERPAKIQQLTWQPARFSANETDPVKQVVFSFYNGQLFRVLIDYNSEKTAGLTERDMIDAVSAKYGPPREHIAATLLAAQVSDNPVGDPVPVLARWEDVKSFCDLVQPPSESYKLLISSKAVNVAAEAAIADGMRMDTQEARALSNLSEANSKTDLDKNRVINTARFRP